MQIVSFYDEHYLYQNFRTIAYDIDKQGGISVPSVKATTYVCNRFNTFVYFLRVLY